MARLPTPVLESIKVTWPEDYKEREKEFFKVMAQCIRNIEKKKKQKEGD